MQIDRARFLLLTMSIGAGSCAPAEPAATAGDGPRPTSPTVVDVAAPDDRPGAQLAGAPDEPSVEERGQPTGAGSGMLSGDDNAGANEGSDEDDGALGALRGGGHPRDHGALPVSKLGQQCRALQPPPGPHCESFDTTLPECEAYERALAPEAAERAVRCLAKKSRTAGLCKFGVTADCFLQGVRGTKTAADAQRLCGPAVSACGAQRWREADMTSANCLAAVSAARPELRGPLISCIAESCGIANCYYAIGSY